MADCDDVKFRIQMKRGDRIYTGVSENLADAMANMINELKSRPNQGDTEVMATNFLEVGRHHAKVNEEVKPLMDLLKAIESLKP